LTEDPKHGDRTRPGTPAENSATGYRDIFSEIILAYWKLISYSGPMGTTTTLTAGLASLPDPQKDRPGKPVPEGIAAVLAILAVLTGYGRHLAETLEHRAVWSGFATIAQFFGTAALPVILAHIKRGLMRAVALERMLRRRAARGRDLVVLARRSRARRIAEPTAPQAAPATADAAVAPPAETPPAQQPAAQAARRTAPEEPLTLDTLPSMEEIEAEVRRSPIGQTIVKICCDLGIAPTLCDGGFWNQVFMAIRCYRGNVGNLVLEMRRREKRLDKEHWKYPGLPLPEETRAGVRRVLGFFIGETPIDPSGPTPEPGAATADAAPAVPVPPAATGPP
jgi:hypothetical protein